MVVLDSSRDLMVRKKVCFNLYYDQAVSWGAEVQVDEISRFICATSLKNNIRLPRWGSVAQIQSAYASNPRVAQEREEEK